MLDFTNVWEKKLISINVTKGIDHTKTLKQSHKVQINRKQ